MWTNIEEDMCSLENLQDKVCKYFELGQTVELRVATEIGWWSADERSLYYGWGEVESDIEKGEVYGGDTRHITSKKEFSLVYYDNGSGENINFVLPNHARITDEETIERIANV